MWHSVGTIVERFLSMVAGSHLLSEESPTQAFVRLKGVVSSLDHKRLFNFVCLVYDLHQKMPRIGLATLLDEIQERCTFAESPASKHRNAFSKLFEAKVAMPKIDVCVIVISHAANPTILPCLGSVFAQTTRPREVVLVEDTPRPNSRAFEAYALDERICLRPSADGVARRSQCRRVGTKIATCPVLLYLDGDTLLGPTVVERVVDWWAAANVVDEGCVSLLIPDIELRPPEPPLKVTYDWVSRYLASNLAPAPGLFSSSGVGIIRAWYDASDVLGPKGGKATETLSWQNVRSRFWSVMRDDVLGVGNWDDSYEGWGTEETDLAYRLHLHRAMRVRILSEKSAYAVHVLHAFDVETRAAEHARNEARLIKKFPHLRAQRMDLARRLGIADLVENYLNA